MAAMSYFPIQDVQVDLTTIAIEVERFARLLNNVKEGRKLCQFQFSQHTNHLIHRLLKTIPLRSCGDLARLDSMLYLGLLALMTTLLNDYGSHRNQYDMLASKLRIAIRYFVPLTEWEEALVLWVSLLAGISILQLNDDGWLLPSLKTRCLSLGLETWEQLILRLGALPWVHSLHGDPGRRLFETARQTCGTPEE